MNKKIKTSKGFNPLHSKLWIISLVISLFVTVLGTGVVAGVGVGIGTGLLALLTLCVTYLFTIGIAKLSLYILKYAHTKEELLNLLFIPSVFTYLNLLGEGIGSLVSFAVGLYLLTEFFNYQVGKIVKFILLNVVFIFVILYIAPFYFSHTLLGF